MQSFGFEGALDFNDRNLSSIEYVLRNKVGIPIFSQWLLLVDLLGLKIKYQFP